MGSTLPSIDELDNRCCLKVVRYGAAGIEEDRSHLHAITAQQVRVLMLGELALLGPGDKIEFTVTRGRQADE